MKAIIPIFLAIIFAHCVCATSMELATDRDTLLVGQTIEIVLDLNNSEKSISGQLSIINLDEMRQESVLFQAVGPVGCCAPDTRVRGDMRQVRRFTPKNQGNYQVRAYFDQMERTVNFTVIDEAHTTKTTLQASDFETGERIELEWYNLQSCKRSRIGGLNSLNADIGEDIIGLWDNHPSSYVLYSCDGSDPREVDNLLLKGGLNIGKNSSVAGSYRILVRCGRNVLVDDLAKCEDLRIYLDTDGIQKKIEGETKDAKEKVQDNGLGENHQAIEEEDETMDALKGSDVAKKENEKAQDAPGYGDSGQKKVKEGETMNDLGQIDKVHGIYPPDIAVLLIVSAALFLALVGIVYRYIGEER